MEGFTHVDIALVVSSANIAVMLTLGAMVWKDGRWKGRVDATLEDLRDHVNRLDDKVTRLLKLNGVKDA